MNGAHLHLIINHAPVFYTFFGVSFFSWGLFKESTQIRKIGAVLFIIGAVSSFITLESGEAAVDQMEQSSISNIHQAVHDHKEAAQIAFWFSVTTGALSVISLLFVNLNIRFKNTLHGVLIITAVFTIFTLIFTAFRGGEI
ncbi:MAG: hypothetical protein GVY20_06670 [Bacteroidetes bacterium]|jgi:glucan phosphoethanolaminetransferase (alkaline phosphatase superfamily)|nr:hypothetical protein [Bacteroidota bacterium]